MLSFLCTASSISTILYYALLTLSDLSLEFEVSSRLDKWCEPISVNKITRLDGWDEMVLKSGCVQYSSSVWRLKIITKFRIHWIRIDWISNILWQKHTTSVLKLYFYVCKDQTSRRRNHKRLVLFKMTKLVLTFLFQRTRESIITTNLEKIYNIDGSGHQMGCNWFIREM